MGSGWSLPFGIILKGIGGFYYVESANDIYECKARGIFRKDEFAPLPGDNVEFSIIDSAKKIGSIDKINPRSVQLVRPAVANINQLLAVFAARNPEPDLMLLDKLLVTAEKKGISIIICINKIDLATEEERESLSKPYLNAGYKVIMSSSKTGEGYSELKPALQGKITVLAGQSGVGKSTMLNNIMNMFVMETGDLSTKSERGKHTTRHAELVMLKNGGYIVDTPGFSSFELDEINYNELQDYYPEYAAGIEKCRFTGCSHVCEPGCVVRESVEAGRVGRDRYNRYVELYNMLKLNDSLKYKKNNRKGK